MSKIYLCSPKKYKDIISLPTIEFELIVSSLNLKEYDTLLFTSKQAIFYTNFLNKEWRDKKILAVGEATKNYAKELGANDIYFPKNYYAKELAKDIITILKNRKILYIRPKAISFNSKDYLQKHSIKIEEKIIYQTICKKYQNKPLNKKSVIIFTSPSTIRCFFKSFSWDDSLKAVVIGNSTLKKLPKNIKAYIANKPTIDSCIKKAIEISKF